MNKSTNTAVEPVRQTWRGLIDKLEVGEAMLIPRDKFNSVSNIVSERFHKLSNKRFSVTYKDSPDGYAEVTRLIDEIE